MDFTYTFYQNLVSRLQDGGYTISDYHSYGKFDKVAILRHDVDMSIDKALKMAQMEHEIGAHSTYFFLISTDFYNIASKSSVSKISRIHDLGHEIGLHFDEVKYGNISNLGGVLPYLHNEIKTMEMILGIPIRSVSMHRPSKETLEADYDFGHIVNSYSRTFFRDFKYLSDSRRHWRENIFDVMASGQYDRLHILTHPFWYNDEELTMKESISQFVNKANYERYLSVRDNIRDIDEIMLESEVVG